jgi:hypothetical protein
VTEGRVDVPTLCALSVMAFVAACVSHEVLGHGLSCLAGGGKITLLTSVYFKCSVGSPFIDAAGPSMNLAVALGAAVALRRFPSSASVRTTLGLVVAFSGFWGAGYFLFSGVTNTGDWAFVLNDLSLESPWLWRIAMGTIGVWLYGITLRCAASALPRGLPLVAAYLAGGAVACASALLYTGPKLPAMIEAAQESLLASLGLVYVALVRPRSPLSVLSFVPRSGRVQALGCGVFALFCLTQGRGYQASPPSVEPTFSGQSAGLSTQCFVGGSAALALCAQPIFEGVS